MNEWDLQHYLSVKWREENLIVEGNEYELVCWELMFPSWRINDKHGKWDEKSVDFIFYSTSLNEFICVEIKNLIRGRKELLSAFCQVTQRTIEFIEQYDSRKMSNAHILCFENASKERGGINYNKGNLTFGVNSEIKRLLIANKFPANAEAELSQWNKFSLQSIKEETKKYKSTLEFNRFSQLTEEQFERIVTQRLLKIELNMQIF